MLRNSLKMKSAPRAHAQRSAVVAELRSMRLKAERAAKANALPGSAAYQKELACVLDEWIARGRGRKQLICLALAAEQGTLELHHLELGRLALMQTNDQALSALYWASVRRWNYAHPPAITETLNKPTETSGRYTRSELCSDCLELELDSRRLSPHRFLQHGEEGLEPQAGPAFRVSWYSCANCNTRWVRRISPSEPFANWVILRRRSIFNAGHNVLCVAK